MRIEDAIQPFDLQRMFIGEDPLWFLLEIAFRTAFLYAFALVLLRLVSRRAVGQLSLIELFLIVALGSAVGDPMFYPEVPLLHGMVVISVVVALNRGLIWMINHTERGETFMEGRPLYLVRNGRIHGREVKLARLNREKLFEMLRGEGVVHLGQIHSAFLEQTGELTVFLHPPARQKPGVRIMPPWDLKPPRRAKAGETLEKNRLVACEGCGKVRGQRAGDPLPRCPACGDRRWVLAVIRRADTEGR